MSGILHRLASVSLALVMLTGCEAIVSFDRTKIPDGSVTDATTDMPRSDMGGDMGMPDSGMCTTAAMCDDTNMCTTDACGTGGMCTHTMMAGCCNGDGDCNDSDMCTSDACDMTAHTCTHNHVTNCCNAAADCNDGVMCTTDTCDTTAHTCSHTSMTGCCTGPADCMDISVCTTDTCDTGTGTCMNTMITGCCLGAGDCNDGDTCTTDACDTGSNTCTHTAVGGGCCTTAADCDDTNPCTDDTCDGTSHCAHAPNTASCTGGQCHASACCTGCWDGAACQAGTMDAVCGSTGVSCTDCTATSATCTGGSCAVPPPTCASYCASVVANCTGANAQYGDMAHCMDACGAFGWATGTSTDASGNTLGCRVYHAGLAATDATTHCPHAGPLGGGACGTSPCADFCAADVAVCGTMAYPDLATCMTDCTAYTDSAAPDLHLISSAQLSCRTYHLTNASASGAAASHCPHTDPTGGGGVCPP